MDNHWDIAWRKVLPYVFILNQSSFKPCPIIEFALQHVWYRPTEYYDHKNLPRSYHFFLLLPIAFRAFIALVWCNDQFFFLAHNITKHKRYIIPCGVLWPKIDEILCDALSVHFTFFDWICCFQFAVIKLLWWKFTDFLVLKQKSGRLQTKVTQKLNFPRWVQQREGMLFFSLFLSMSLDFSPRLTSFSLFSQWAHITQFKESFQCERCFS